MQKFSKWWKIHKKISSLKIGKNEPQGDQTQIYTCFPAYLESFWKISSKSIEIFIIKKNSYKINFSR